MLSHFSHVQLFVTLMDCSLPGSSVHEILQARILEWASMPSSEDLPHCLTHITLTRSVLTHDWQILWSLLFTANLTSVAFDTVDCLLPFGKLFLTWHLGQQTLEVLFLLIVHLTFFS